MTDPASLPDKTNGSRVAEERRILRAAADGKLRLNEHGRYVVEESERPAREERERLLRYGWLWRPAGRDCPVIITAEGRGALAAMETPHV